MVEACAVQNQPDDVEVDADGNCKQSPWHPLTIANATEVHEVEHEPKERRFQKKTVEVPVVSAKVNIITNCYKIQDV